MLIWRGLFWSNLTCYPGSLLFLWLACCLPICHAQSVAKPNVLMILVDDLKPTLGCYGDAIAKTPNIDRLAQRSLRFEMAYCNQAVCAPSRFTLMLGSHSTSTGLYGLGSKLRTILPDAITLPQLFAANGYRTESLGKVFHVGHGNEGDPISFAVPHFADKVIEYLDPASTQGGQLTREEALFTNQQLGNIRALPRGAAFESPDVEDTSYADGRIAAETVKRIQAAKQRRDLDGTPFFMVAGFVRPHLPFSVPRRYWNLYDPADLRLPNFENLPKDAPTVAGKMGGEIAAYTPVPEDRKQAYPADLKRSLIHGYYAATSFVDAQIGKVIDECDRLNMLENTIVVFWSDHGFHLGDHGIWTKHTNYEQANRIPLLIYAPGISKVGTTRQLAESVDLYPTLAEPAALAIPGRIQDASKEATGQARQSLDGVSLVPVLHDPETRVRDHAYHVYPNAKLGRAIRTDRYRLVQWKKHNESDAEAEIELYDYQLDPDEKINCAAEQTDVVQSMLRMLERHPPAVNNR